MHPYKDQANSTHKAKTGNLGKSANKDIPVMRAVGENSAKKLYSGSSSSGQHQDQAKADGMKRGGHVGKPKHSKPKLPMVVPEVTATPPSPDPSLAAAGAGSSPVPAPPMPPMKRGGRMTAGGESGLGRLQKAKASGMKPIK